LHEAEVAVLLDLTPLPDRNANSFVNRNRIYDSAHSKDAWLTVPISRGRGQTIRNVRISHGERPWYEKHINRIGSFFPSHESTAPGFLEALGERLTNHPPELLALNSIVNSFLLSQLRQPVSLVLESKLVERHSREHRLDIAMALGASIYVAGDVEWKTMEATGHLELFARAGVEVVKSPNPSEVGFDQSMVRDLSCVDAICRVGVDKTAQVLAGMIEVGRVHVKGSSPPNLMAPPSRAQSSGHNCSRRPPIKSNAPHCS
jgi:hypothetical protein